MNNLLITGSCGFIGSRLFQSLVDQGLNYTGGKIICIDNLRYQQYHIANWQASTPNCLFYNLDLTKDESWPQIEKILDTCTTIIHLAALVGEPVCKKFEDEATKLNLEATKRLVDILTPTQHIIFANTNSQYGASKDICTELSPENPLSLYAKTKCEAEKIVLSHGRSTSFRLSTVGGLSPRTRTDLIVNDWTMKAFYEKKLSIFEGEAIRNYVNIQDVCDVILYAIDRERDAANLNLRGAFNVVDERYNISKMQIAEIIADLAPHKVKLTKQKGKDFDKRNCAVSGAKLREAGFVPRFTLEKTVKELFRYLENTVKDQEQLFRQLGSNINDN